MAEKARSAGGRNHLTLPALVAAFIALIQQLEERKHGVIQSGAVETVYGGEIGHGGLPCVLHEIGQGVPRLQVFEHWACHSCVGD